ncbi:MAG: hypothetical protein C4320_01560, partial [Armatimonadota bacterium]
MRVSGGEEDRPIQVQGQHPDGHQERSISPLVMHPSGPIPLVGGEASRFMEAEFIFVRRSLESQIRELPPLPTAVTKVLQASQDPMVPIEEIGKVISSDQALTTKILRTVNSSYYGLARQIANVTQAVVILGMEQVRNVTMASAAGGAFKGKGAKHEAVLNQFWSHSFAASATAGGIAVSRRWAPKRVCELQTAGLVADMGRLFLYASFPDAFCTLIDRAKAAGVDFETAEREIMGMPHAAIGSEIADRWGFPASIVTTIAAHEHQFPLDAEDDAAVIRLADASQK